MEQHLGPRTAVVNVPRVNNRDRTHAIPGAHSVTLRLLLLALVFALGLVSPSAHAARQDLTVQEQYELGMRYMKRGYYVKALEEFTKIRTQHPDDPYADEAAIAIADLHFKKAEWDQARVAYEEFLRLHPRHERVHYVVYRLGLTAFKKAPRIAARDQTWTRQAVNTWTGFEARYAGSEYVDEVNQSLAEARDRLAHKEFIIGEFYFKRRAYVGALGRLEGMLRLYPGCSDTADALAMIAVARFKTGDEAAAREALGRLQTDFPDDPALRLVRRKAPELLRE